MNMEDTYKVNIKEELDEDVRLEDTIIADITEEELIKDDISVENTNIANIIEEDICVEDTNISNIKDEELDQMSIEDILDSVHDVTSTGRFYILLLDEDVMHLFTLTSNSSNVEWTVLCMANGF